jgi:AbrB family looped-hinge helix DNA binding protein
METTRLSTKGQIVLPRSIRDSRDLKPGTEFTVEETADGILLKPAPAFPRTTLEEVDAVLRKIRAAVKKRTGRTKPLTLAEMDAAIASEVLRRHARGRY